MNGGRAWAALVAAALVLAGCWGGTHDVYSDYFLVVFAAKTANPTDEGRTALANAVADARRSGVSQIDVHSYTNGAPANEASDPLTAQRLQVVQAALAKGGVDGRLVQHADEAVGDHGFITLGDGIVIQIRFGTRAPPK